MIEELERAARRADAWWLHRFEWPETSAILEQQFCVVAAVPHESIWEVNLREFGVKE